jgi:hypothetical protein
MLEMTTYWCFFTGWWFSHCPIQGVKDTPDVFWHTTPSILDNTDILHFLSCVYASVVHGVVEYEYGTFKI